MPPKKNAPAQESEAAETVVDNGEVAESEPERAAIAEAPTADVDAEFPTPWHREAYIDGLKREIDGAKRRVKELTAADAHPQVLAEAKAMVDNAQAELKRLTD